MGPSTQNPGDITSGAALGFSAWVKISILFLVSSCMASVSDDFD